MLVTLRIKNLALVDDLTIDWRPGYNAITGETGAGKSILIGALMLVLGERADRTVIREGAESCLIEAVFDVTGLKAPIPALLEANGLENCEGGQLLLKRSIGSSGTNRQFVNGSPTTLKVMAELGEWLVDIHGPHEHQSLLQPRSQLAIMDSFGKLDSQRETYANLIRRRNAVEAQKAALIVDEKTYLQQVELLRFQVREIASARLELDEDRRVEQDYTRAGNSARLLQLSQAALDLIGESDSSMIVQAGALGRMLQDLQRVDGCAAALVQLHEQTVAGLRELQAAVSHYADRIELDPARLQSLEERLNLLQSLKRKYGPSLNEVIAFGQEAHQKLTNLEQRDETVARFNAQLDALADEAFAAGAILSTNRRKLASQLSKEVSRQLADLGFKQSRFEIALHSASETEFRQQLAHPSTQGFDRAEFQFAPNPGEPMRPLHAIASSGELARVMLALKTVLATEDQIPVLVFDEVDANIGGETARVVGEKMREVAKNRQVLCITHLPQVAASASAHFLVNKEVRGGRTFSQVLLLRPQQRVTELARMLGGQSEVSRKHAEALLTG